MRSCFSLWFPNIMAAILWTYFAASAAQIKRNTSTSVDRLLWTCGCREGPDNGPFWHDSALTSLPSQVVS
jgi:hypothetical protein